MEYVSFQDVSLSRLGMGNMRLPVVGDKDGAPIDFARAEQIIDYGMAHDINYYDTAYMYHNGTSENCVGKALAKYDRDSFYVATKFHVGVNPDYRQVFAQQLERLGMDRIDFYLIHCVMDNNVDTYLTNGCIDFFMEQKKAGKIRYLGFSFHGGLETLRKFSAHHQWDFAQLQLNCYDWRYGNTAEEYRILTEAGIPVWVMEPVRGGRLATLGAQSAALLKARHPDWSIASWALRWVRRLPNVKVILSGMSTLGQIEDNVATFCDETALTDEDAALLDQALDLFRQEMSVPCTGCRYCCDDCPMGINIPEYITCYNRFKVDGHGAINAMRRVESKGKPADCISCGGCTGHCPQSIDVPALMAEMAELMK